MDKVIGFISKYAGELFNIITVLDTLIDSSSVLRDDRLGLKKIIDELKGNVDSIKEALERGEIETVVIKKSDIDNAVAEQLEKIKAEIIAELSKEGETDAPSS
jgi:hypothetical protein